jgi:hypothetical protein
MGEYKTAKDRLEEYLKIPDSKYKKEAKVQLDRLYFAFDENEKDKNVVIKQYDKFIEDYAGTDIAKMAILKKAKLLFNQNRFVEILSMKDSLSALKDDNANKLLIDSAVNVAVYKMKKGECQESLSLLSSYKIKLNSSYDEVLFSCAYNQKDYTQALAIASNHIKSQNINEKLLWMYRFEKVILGQKKYKDALNLSKDIISIATNSKDKSYLEVYYDAFDSAFNLGDYKLALSYAQKTDELFPNNKKNIRVFKDVIRIATNKKDDNVIAIYSKKLLDIQNITNYYPESPWVDFVYANYLQRTNQHQNAINIIEKVKNISTQEDKSRAKYMLAVSYRDINQKKKKKTKIDECISYGNNVWSKLCKDMLDLIK